MAESVAACTVRTSQHQRKPNPSALYARQDSTRGTFRAQRIASGTTAIARPGSMYGSLVGGPVTLGLAESARDPPFVARFVARFVWSTDRKATRGLRTSRYCQGPNVG